MIAALTPRGISPRAPFLTQRAESGICRELVSDLEMHPVGSRLDTGREDARFVPTAYDHGGIRDPLPVRSWFLPFGISRASRQEQGRGGYEQRGPRLYASRPVHVV